MANRSEVKKIAVMMLGGIFSLSTIVSACKTNGKVAEGKIEISGIISEGENGKPLKYAIITNSRTEKSVLSDSLGHFKILCEEGDSLLISYVGFVSKNIRVNPADSTAWNISMREYGPIIEPALMKSYSTNDKLKMVVINPDALTLPVDSIVVEMINYSDEEATFGEWFHLEELVDGKWIKVPYNGRVQKQIDQGCVMVFNDIGYGISPNGSRTHVNPTKAYNEMINPGKYRISKTFWYSPYSIEKSDTAYVEFEIL